MSANTIGEEGGEHLKDWVSATELGRPDWLDNQHSVHCATIFIAQILLFSHEEVSLEDKLKNLQRSCFSINKSRLWRKTIYH